VCVHAAAPGDDLDPDGTPVSLDDIAQPAQRDQGGGLVGGVYRQIEVVVPTSLGADEGVDAPSAADPGPASRRGQGVQHGMHLGRLMSPAPIMWSGYPNLPSPAIELDSVAYGMSQVTARSAADEHADEARHASDFTCKIEEW
jgi:hypothetical protein